MGDKKNKGGGRLEYFDPNTSVYANKEGTDSDSINFPYEDYSIAVDLQIRKYNRYGCGLGEDGTEVHEFSTKNGTLSFLGGTNGVLTTNYTDIQMVNPTGNTEECLGIESITVSYDSWLHPTVFVKFVDVRGGTVMQPAEANYYGSKSGSTYEIYKSLFSFPYPLFLLKVKGFYGKGVTYRLAVNKVDIDFDASSGNFIISVEFIGHIYGMFADVPMTYILSAPFMKEGQAYWNDKIADGTFWFCEYNKDGKLIRRKEMITMPKLAKTIREVLESPEMAKIKSDKKERIDSADGQKSALEGLINSYPFDFEKNGRFKGDSNVYYFDNDSKPYSFFVFCNSEMKKEFVDAVVAYSEKVKNYNETFAGNYDFSAFRMFDGKHSDDSYISNFPNCVKMSKNKNGVFVINGISRGAINGYLSNIPSDKNDYSVVDGYRKFIKDVISSNGLMNSFTAVAVEKNGKIHKEILKEMKETLNRANKSKDDIEKDFESKKNGFIEKALGFRPSIKNIYDLIFAHFDTFMHVYYQMLSTIKDQLQIKSDIRKKLTYQIGDDDTDTEPASRGLRGEFLPPFTSFYKKCVSNENKKELVWPVEIVGDGLEEVKLVYDLLSASKMYFNEYQDAMNSDNGVGFGNTGLSANINKFIPLTIYDIANSGRIGNPYTYVAEKIKNNADYEEVVGDIYAIFSLRMAYYMNCFGNGGGNIDENEVRAFSRLEVVNFFKAVGKSSSPTLKNAIYSLTEDRIKNIKKAKRSWTVENSTTTNGNLFKTEGNNLIYSYSKTRKENYRLGEVEIDAYPIGIGNLTKLKDDFSNGIPIYKEGYISSKSHEFYSGLTGTVSVGNTLPGGTFLLYENGTYLNELYNSINEEISTEKDNIENSIVDSETYEMIRSGSTFNMFKNNIDENVKIVIRKYSVCDSTGIPKSGNIEDEITISPKECESGLYVKFPDAIDEWKSTANIDASGHVIKNLRGNEMGNGFFNGKDYGAICLLEHPLYWLQNNNENLEYINLAKAYLFIQALPIDSELLGISYKINGVIQRASLLREGAFYWWEENYDKNIVITKGNCKEYPTAINENGDYPQEYYYASTNVSYVCPDSAHTFISNYGRYGDTGLTYKNFETFNPIPKASEVKGEYYPFPWLWKEKMHDGHLPSIHFKNISNSRRYYLKKYFEQWAKSEFSSVVKSYEDLHLYGEGTDGLRKYSNGLDISLCTGGYSVASDYPEKAKELQEFLKKLFFGVCTVFDYYGGCYTDEGMKINMNVFANGLYTFKEQLDKIYGDIKDASQYDINLAFAKNVEEDPFKNKDLRLSTYMTLKSLYDKWICSSLKGKDTWRFNRSDIENGIKNWKKSLSRYNEKCDMGKCELDNFIYVDSFYRDIGYELCVNLTKVNEWVENCLPSVKKDETEGIMSYTSRSVYEFLTDVAQDCGAILLAVPQRFMYDTASNIKTVFTPIPVCEPWDDDTFTYMFLYNYKPSEHLGDVDTSDIDMNGWSPNGDGFSLTNEEICGALFDVNEHGYSVPAFGVTFAKQNQSYFKNISLTTKQHGITEAGLNATFQIASKSSEEPRETTLYGQDIYKIYSNNSYECMVEMMGNMQIFPPMYFQLNNIPMWKGAYMIKKVTHTIKPGDATTTFVGVRQNKYLIPMVEGAIPVDSTDNWNSSSYGDISNLNIDGNDIGNNAGEGVEQVPQNLNKVISEDKDIDKNDISPTKPIICLTAGHYKGGEKSKEHAWATRLIKDYIIPRLRTQKFKDGTSYEKHIFMGGKKDKEGMQSSSYDFSPVRHLISKYGSDCVISVNIHWNGNNGAYWADFYGRKGADETLYYRPDSRKFGCYMREAARKVYEGRNGYSKMPEGMMEKGIKEEKGGPLCYLLKPTNTDPGAGFPFGGKKVNCACVLTENWFPNFYPKTGKKINWLADNWDEIDSETGRYCNGRGWLESDEGCSVLADMHVNGIVNYINSLGSEGV